ncbi:unnamed protein product [Paramecium primaurelia]|uniref:Uncharacterized protein n=1 Tax=Paramecium primaurelia TaxID=5886 RepID=A0A8S1MX22_PARPR|nr:unnamed protein product [Paramecium primaurelia]
MIEIWDLQLNAAAQSTSYFKSTSHKPYCSQDEQRINQNQLRDVLITLNQQGSNDYRRGKYEIQISNPLLPISEEEEEKQQGK